MGSKKKLIKSKGAVGKSKSLDKTDGFKGTFKKLLKYLKSYKFRILFVIVLSAGSSVISIFGPKILGNATTEISNGLISKLTGKAGIDFDKIMKILLTLLCLYIISMACSIIRNLITSGVTQKIIYRLRDDLSKKFNKIPLTYFEERTTEEVLSIVTDDIDVVGSNLSQCLVQVVSSLTVLIGIVVMMFTISTTLTIASLITILVSFISIKIIAKRSKKSFVIEQDCLAEVNSQVEEVYSNHVIVKTFDNEADVREKFEKANDTLYESALKSQYLLSMMYPVINFIENLGYVMISILGGYLTIRGKLEIGYILSFSLYIRQFNQPIMQSSQIINLFKSMVTSARHVFRLLDVKEEKEANNGKVKLSKIKGNIEFRNVEFGYTKDKPIIKNLNIKIRKGQKIAIVGSTEAGKTTLVKLLTRFYDVNKGQILIDGKNIKEYKRTDLRSLFGMVLKDNWLFNGTIEDNMKYGKLNATREEIEDVAKTLHIDHFINTLPDGYDMVINEEEANISEGEKQLLAIARVILKDPKILILDEATSLVDTRLELLIQEALDKLMKNRTSFIIAHRLSTVRNADLILVMDKGNIVEKGTHQELLKKNGFYSKLYNLQFKK